MRLMMMKKLSAIFSFFIIIASMAFAGDEPLAGQDTMPERFIPITVTDVKVQDLEVWESSVGQVEAKVAPLISAEVAGRLIAVMADVGAPIKKGQILARIDAKDFELSKAMANADIKRLDALIHAQELKSKRYHELVKKQSVNQSLLDDVDAQLGALKAELIASQVTRQQAERDIEKSIIISPIDGWVDNTQVSQGSYVKVGAPIMRIGNLQRLKVRLPFPETLLFKLHPGLPIKLNCPAIPGSTIETTVSEVRPSITYGSRAAQVIVNIENPGQWKPGATVTAKLRVELHEKVMLLPELSVVHRPAGTVVYVIDNGKAVQHIVTTGIRTNGLVEILSGVEEHHRVALDGAGFLSDNTAVEVKE